MLNKIVLMGRLTRDPELRKTTSGTAVASFSLAVDRNFKNKETGEKETDFIDIVAWRNTAEFVGKYFSKGRMAIVEGRLQIRPWEDRQGNKRRSAEVVADNVYFGDSKQSDGGYQQTAYDSGYNSGHGIPEDRSHVDSGGGYPSYPPSDYGDFSEIGGEDEDLPF